MEWRYWAPRRECDLLPRQGGIMRGRQHQKRTHYPRRSHAVCTPTVTHPGVPIPGDSRFGRFRLRSVDRRYLSGD